jgi:predicted ABC-type transport system involved in lysophospholipase L1 biosynthesis ATPase subunit
LNRAGQTIVMVTHDERVAKRAGRTITLADGRVK